MKKLVAVLLALVLCLTGLTALADRAPMDVKDLKRVK